MMGMVNLKERHTYLGGLMSPSYEMSLQINEVTGCKKGQGKSEVGGSHAVIEQQQYLAVLSLHAL
jgi:hypothetical protein